MKRKFIEIYLFFYTHKINFVKEVPEIRDAVALPNTAGYMKHLYETETYLFERTIKGI